MAEEYQIPMDWDEPEIPPNWEQKKDYEKMVDFVTGLSESENQFIRNYAMANKSSKLEIKDYKEVLKTFRLDRAKNFKGANLQERLANATFEEKGKILAEVGLAKQDPLNSPSTNLFPDEISESELHSSESIGGYNRKPLYRSADQPELNKTLDEINKARSPLGDALAGEEIEKKREAEKQKRIINAKPKPEPSFPYFH